jgi:hypothetical protein
MKKTIALAAILALAACGDAGSEAEETAATAAATPAAEAVDGSGVLTGEAPGFEAVAPGTYQVTRAGGEVDYIEIHPGLTFSRIAADGAATGGSIFMKGGQTCFIVEGQEQETCFTDGPRQEDGSMQTTAANGNVATVRPVAGTLADHAEAAR